MQNSDILTSLCSWEYSFGPYVAENLEDWFSRTEARMKWGERPITAHKDTLSRCFNVAHAFRQTQFEKCKIK